ncbi:MAG: 4Fe-4S binding protein [Bacteriovoracia bacterium]
MPLGMPTRHVRIGVQTAVFSLWVALILATKHPMDSWLAKHIPVSIMLRIDPLVTTVVSGGMRMAVTITLLGLVTLGVSLLLGRVFCGWVCPLGAIFDFYGWFLRKFRVPFEGPSPSWFRLKYYLLFAILIFALIGGVSPLMGFDPIVLITRVAAVVLNPLIREHDKLLWTVGDAPGYFGYFIDISTLALFLAIMGGTTRLSRIWCRTACPLGAYLALLGRNSVLRRDTKGCVHCNICSNHCPTGAISFTNAEVYNESECIKCFACSQECPVDANFFTLKSPFPAASPSQYPVSLERRDLIATAAFTVLAAPALNLSGGESGAHKRLLRPPMSREEHDFLASCIRCNECTKACPTGILKPAELQHGLRALWSPVMVPTEGYCKEGCSACSQACPTDAIMKYPIEKKYTFKSGTAMFETNRCISYTDNKFCSECVRVCPTDAIEISRDWEPAGGVTKAKGADFPAPAGRVPTRPTRVNYDRCIGCGACEWVCDKIVVGEPAMVTTSFGRATPSNFEAKGGVSGVSGPEGWKHKK